MKIRWTADITNDPQRDYDLCIEICEGNEHRATIFRGSSGNLSLKVYPNKTAFEVPALWLVQLLQKAEEELP